MQECGLSDAQTVQLLHPISQCLWDRRLFQAPPRTPAVVQPASVAAPAAVSPCCLSKSASLRRKPCVSCRKPAWLCRAPRPRTTAPWPWPAAGVSGWVSTIAWRISCGKLRMGNVERSQPPQPGGHRTSRPPRRARAAFSWILAAGLMRIVITGDISFTRCVSIPAASSRSARSMDG